jgi:hypothetical protein
LGELKIGGSWSRLARHKVRAYLKNNEDKKGQQSCSRVEHLTRKCEGLSLIPNTAKQTNKKSKRNIYQYLKPI